MGRKKMTQKKSVDFNTLDFSKVTGEEKAKVIPAPVEGLPEKIPEKLPIQDGYWIAGKSIEEVSPTEVKEWLCSLLPGTGMDKIADKDLDSPKLRKRVIDRLGQTMGSVFFGPVYTDKKNPKLEIN